jgi:hypothetical protein
MMIKDSEYIEAARREVGYVNGETVGLKILIAIGPPALTDDDAWIMSEATEELIEKLMTARTARDPKTLQAKDAMQESFRQIFVHAGLTPLFMKEIPNEYCGRHCCLGKPWFIVTSKIGPVKIGWRKRVINIDWSQSECARDIGQVLFPNLNVTVGTSFIHAWSDNDASVYLDRLRCAWLRGEHQEKELK